jgi:hypothetical protein
MVFHPLDSQPSIISYNLYMNSWSVSMIKVCMHTYSPIFLWLLLFHGYQLNNMLEIWFSWIENVE